MANYLESGFETLNNMDDKTFAFFSKNIILSFITENNITDDDLFSQSLSSKEQLVSEQTIIFIIQQLMASLDKDKTIKTLLDKIKGLKPEKKVILLELIELYEAKIKREYVQKLIAGSGYYLSDFNWNVNMTLSSDKLSKIKQGICQLELTLKKGDSNESKKVLVELNSEELENFVQNLYILQSKLESNV